MAPDPVPERVASVPEAVLAVLAAPQRVHEASEPVWKSKFYGAFVLNRRVVLHAIDATRARWRGDTSPVVHVHVVEKGDVLSLRLRRGDCK